MLKSVFESELVDGMHKGLIKQANNQEVDNLTQAVDYLNSAIDIFENQGLTIQADKVLNLLVKIANRKNTNVQKLLSFQPLKNYLKELKFPETYFDILLKESFINKNSKMLHELKRLMYQVPEYKGNEDQINAMIDSAYKEIEEDYPVFEMRSLMQPEFKNITMPPTNDPSFTLTSIGKKHKRQDNIMNSHTKNLTPEKMIENLKHHGTMFDMVDLSFDDDLDLDIDDNLNIDEVQFLETFEDELKK